MAAPKKRKRLHPLCTVCELPIACWNCPQCAKKHATSVGARRSIWPHCGGSGRQQTAAESNGHPGDRRIGSMFYGRNNLADLVKAA
jgi:hypothetical protein